MTKGGVFGISENFITYPKVGVWEVPVTQNSQTLTPIDSYIFFNVLIKNKEQHNL